MRFGKLLKEAVYNPHFSISYRKGFWRSIDVLSRTSESLIFIDDVSPAASGGYCDYEDLAVWGEGEGGLWGVSWVFIVLREMSHKHSWTSWLTEDSSAAAQSSETSINKRTRLKEVLEAFLQNCVLLLHVDVEHSFTFIHFADAFFRRANEENYMHSIIKETTILAVLE